MKIAYFVNEFPSFSQTFVLDQITGLMDRGHSVDIYAMKRLDVHKTHAEVERYGLMERVQYQEEIPRNYFLRAFKASSMLVKNYGSYEPIAVMKGLNVLKHHRMAASLRLLYAAMLPIGGQPYDAIHANLGTLGLTVLALSQIGAIKGTLVVSFRGFDATKYLQNRPRAYDQLFAAGNLFLPVSLSIRQRLVEAGCDPEKIVVHHDGIVCTKFKYLERRRGADETTKVVTIGRLVEKKGIEYAIRAVAKLLGSGRRIIYYVVGDGELRGELERLIAELGVGNEVRLLGWMERDELIHFMQDMHLMVASSVTARDGDQEGIPSTIKEALALGLPVLGTEHSGIPELVEDGVSGFLVPERDVEALADRLMRLVDNPDKWPEMGRAGRVRVESSFDVEKLNDQLVTMYSDLEQ